MTVQFQTDGQKFIALNGGSNSKFTEALSFHVDCKTHYAKKIEPGLIVRLLCARCRLGGERCELLTAEGCA